MPNKKFLETYPLYRKINFDLQKPYFYSGGYGSSHSGTLISDIPKPAINMNCPVCDSAQTFNMINEFYVQEANSPFHRNQSPNGKNFDLDYLCMGCKNFHYFFFVEFGVTITKKKDGDLAWSDGWVRKIGQKPEWNKEIDKSLVPILGKNANIYKQGLICESQSFGIGAYSYYRRVLENIISELLIQIESIIPEGDEKDIFTEALAKTKLEPIASNKIELVKDLLPRSLYVTNTNPLEVLYETTSVGLHEMDDEDCLEYAEAIRSCLIAVIKEIESHKGMNSGFTDGIRKLLDKKSKLIAKNKK